MKLEDRIFSIQSNDEFEEVALEVFHFQYENNELYHSFVNHIKKKNITSIKEIPFLPIEFFKTHQVLTGTTKPQLIFQSSGTTDSVRSKHYVAFPEIYIRSFVQGFKQFIGDPKELIVLALLPNYLEQGNSSLVFMVKELIQLTQNDLSGFVLNEQERIEHAYLEAKKTNKKIVLFGVSYALLDLAENGIDLSLATIIETGGMKGRRKELTREELHAQIKKGTGVSFVRSEYGMTELLSQAYSNQNGLFETPPWMRVIMRDPNDPFDILANEKTGGINVIDLANLYSCSFIATQDLGKQYGANFSVLGRFDQSDIRGCNLMVE